MTDLLEANLAELASEGVLAVEDLPRVRNMFDSFRLEDRGWELLTGSGLSQEAGPSLDQIHQVHRLLSEEVAGSALPKRANELRHSYTFGKGFLIPALGVEDNTGRGRRRSVPSPFGFYWNPANQETIFGPEAQVAMHAATSTSGVFLFLGDDATRTGRAIPVTQVTALWTNPDFNDEIWAYRREWSSPDVSGRMVKFSEWVLTDRFPAGSVRPRFIGTGVDRVAVAEGKTIIDLRVNAQVGWALGVPDLMAGQVWNRKYLKMIQDGEEVSHTLALYAAKVRARTKAGAQNIGAQVSRNGAKVGKTITYGAENEVDVFSTAGKTYDFGGLRIFAAFYASSVGVPLTDLTADPSSAGASYGSAAALMPSSRRTIEVRRSLWASWYARVFRWGTGQNVEVVPESIEETDPYRRMQLLQLAWMSGLVHEAEVRPAMLRLAGLSPTDGGAPEGVKVPNNVNFDGAELTASTASPDQGVSNGTGGSDNSTRKDLLNDDGVI